MKKISIVALLFLVFINRSYGQCENMIDSLGRKQGNWCFNKYLYDYLQDSIPFKYKEGMYYNDKPIGKWYFYKEGSDLIPYSVIEYLIDSGIIDNEICFISKDSLFLGSIYNNGEYNVECKFDSLTRKYLCSKQYGNIYLYVKEVDTFMEAKRCIRYKWMKPYYLIIGRKRILVTDRTKLSRKYKLP